MKLKPYLSFLTLAISLVVGDRSARSQTYTPSDRIPVSDGTMNTQVSGSGNNFNITGGVNRGQTLFHSFTDFSVPIDNNGFVFVGTGLQRSDILLTNGAGITARVTGTLDTVNTFFNNATSNGSSINISANNLTLLNAGANSNTLFAAIDAGLDTNSGVQTKPGGNINIDATGKVSLNNSNIKNTLRSGAEGSIGDIKIQAGALDIINSGISTATAGTGNAGNISFTVNGRLAINNNSNISTATFEKGNAGDINIKTTGDIKISGYDSSSTTPISSITSGTTGQGDAGKITIDTQGKLSLINSGFITSDILATGVGNSKGISITARELELANNGFISTGTDGKGNAGDINIKTTGDINISGYDPSSTSSVLSQISSDTSGQGDAGKITIDTQGKLSLVNHGVINSGISSTAVGNSKGINITARELELANNSFIFTSSLPNSQGNTGDINIKTTGDIKISGFDPSSTNPTILNTSNTSFVNSDTSGRGDTGKITIDTQGKLSLVNNGKISSAIGPTGVGNSKGISITARELELANNSSIFTSSLSNSQGNTGDINIKTTGDIKISGYDPSSTNSVLSQITSTTSGRGDTGKITIDTQGKLSVVDRGHISSAIGSTAVGNSKGINITAREIELANNSFIFTNTFSTVQGNAGDINIKTTGDIKISGYNSSSINPKTSDRSSINSSTSGRGDTGKMTLDVRGKLSVVNGGFISSSIGSTAVGNGRGIFISSREIELTNNSFIDTITSQTTKVEGTGKAGDINLNVQGSIQLNNVSVVSTSSLSTGQAGNISITGDRLLLQNQGAVTSFGSTATGGDISIFLGDKLLMRNNSDISSESGSNGGNGNGGNITISSPLIIALPGNNDIIANAYQGTGGRVNITSQGLFGIQYRPIGSDATNATNDITSSSTFGQNGTVNISTPGTDPGRDTTELPNTTTDASNQISQVCSTNNRQNKLTVTGRGGLPPNANDPLTSDVVWQDARATSRQPVAIGSIPLFILFSYINFSLAIHQRIRRSMLFYL